MYFGRNASGSAPHHSIKDAKARESGDYDGITTEVNGKSRIMRQIYVSRNKHEPLTKDDINLRKSTGNPSNSDIET